MVLYSYNSYYYYHNCTLYRKVFISLCFKYSYDPVHPDSLDPNYGVGLLLTRNTRGSREVLRILGKIPKNVQTTARLEINKSKFNKKNDKELRDTKTSL